MRSSTLMIVGLVVAFVIFVVVAFVGAKKNIESRQKVLLLALPILVFAGFAMASYAAQPSPLAEFDSYVATYLAVSDRQSGDIYIRGKVIPMDVVEQHPDAAFYDKLPETLRATTPEEVGTVVRLDCTNLTRYFCNRRLNPVQYRCEVTLVDMAIPAIVGEARFEGPGGPLGYVDTLYEDAIDYLLSLPRK